MISLRVPLMAQDILTLPGHRVLLSLWEFVFFSLSSFVLCRIFVSNYVVIFASFLSVWVFNCDSYQLNMKLYICMAVYSYDSEIYIALNIVISTTGPQECTRDTTTPRSSNWFSPDNPDISTIARLSHDTMDILLRVTYQTPIIRISSTFSTHVQNSCITA